MASVDIGKVEVVAHPASQHLAVKTESLHQLYMMSTEIYSLKFFFFFSCCSLIPFNDFLFQLGLPWQAEFIVRLSHLSNHEAHWTGYIEGRVVGLENSKVLELGETL